MKQLISVMALMLSLNALAQGDRMGYSDVEVVTEK